MWDSLFDYDETLPEPKKNFTTEETFWCYVLRDAYKTVCGQVALFTSGVIDREEMVEQVHEDREWFLSDRFEPGSFQWICQMLDLNSDFIRRKVEGQGVLSGGIMTRDGRSAPKWQ